MSYSQKTLIDLMKAGKFPGETSQPKHIETVISNVFIFDNKVYKFYKNDNDFFNKGFRDISGKEARLSFTEKDYKWNDTLSPSVYIRLADVAVRGGVIKEVDSRESAEEVMIVMNRVDTRDVLFEKLISGKINKEDSFEIGRQLGENMKKVQIPLTKVYNFYDLFKSRIKDLRDWIQPMAEYISEKESGIYCDFLTDFSNKNREWFESKLTAEVTTDGDFHSQNVIYSNNTLYLMDTYSPTEKWGVGHKLIPLYRIGVDIWALSGNKDFFEAFIKGYESGNSIKVDRKLDDLYVIYAAGIAVSYLYLLQRTDSDKMEPARKFHQFIRNYYKSIASYR